MAFGSVLYQREMEWCLDTIGDIIDGFEKLDEESPYDNGYSYEDVNDVDIVWRDKIVSSFI